MKYPGYVFAIIRPIDIAHFSFLIGNVFGQIVEAVEVVQVVKAAHSDRSP